MLRFSIVLLCLIKSSLSFAQGYDVFGKTIIKILDRYNNWKATVIGDEPREKFFFKLIELKEAEQLYKEHISNISETIKNIKELN